MILWLAITIFAHLLNAIVFIIDKHLVSKTVMKPVAYAFYTSIFQIFYIVLIPLLGISLPEQKYLILSFVIGVLFTFILVVFYKAMQAAESTRVIPVVGGLTPVFTLFLAYLFIGERLGIGRIIALIFFVFGGFLLSFSFKKEYLKPIKGIGLAVSAAFLFAVYYALMKFLFTNVDFLSGFIAIQVGSFFGALTIALPRNNRKLIFFPAGAAPAMKKETLFLFVPDKILGALAGILIPYAISMENSSVTIINSLQAIQYVFFLLFAIILSKKFPDFFKEQIEKKVLKRKILAVIFIGLGLVALQLSIND